MGFSVNSSGGKSGVFTGLFSGQWYGGSINGASVTSQALSLNDFRMSPFVFPEKFTFSKIRFNILATGTATLAKVYIFDSNTDGFPTDAPIFTSTDISTTTTGIKEVNYTYTFEANKVYWMAIQVNGTVTPYCINGGGCFNLGDTNSFGNFCSIRSILVNYNPVISLSASIGSLSNVRATNLPVNFSFLKV